MKFDAKSVSGKRLEIAEETQILIVGAGPAGTAAAGQARAAGAEVILVDENPVPFQEMGESIPQLWGHRMGGQIRNRNAMLETVLLARPDLAALFDIGVDIRLGAACWGLYANQANMGWMPGLVAGVLDHEAGNRLISCQQVIVATGRRDMGLAFPGWDVPGVMGAGAAVMLTRLYNACDGAVGVMLGSTDDAVMHALNLHDAGMKIAAIVERSEAPLCTRALQDRAQAAGLAFRLGQVPTGVTADTGGVTGLILRDGTIACDTVLLGIGAVPMIDLLQSAGARVGFDDARSGFVPVLGDGMETSLAGVRVAGDSAGIWAAKTGNPELAAAEGRIAAAAALAAIGLAGGERPDRPSPPANASYDLGEYRKGWVRAAVVEAQSQATVCQCEEVTAHDVLEVRPPRYLKAAPKENNRRTLSEILDAGPPDPDQIKRLTRAGMGACQGRRCREQVQALLALQDDLALGSIPLAGYRAPVRPMRLADAVVAEDPAMTDNWDPWMGIPLQWAPYWHIRGKYSVKTLRAEEEYVNE